MKFRDIISVGLIAGAAATGPAGAADPILHPVKEVCIRYAMKGQMMNGATLRCHRMNGFEQFEIQNIEIGIGKIKQKQKQHTITIGDTVYAIDTAAMTGTKTINPMYETIVGAMQGRSPEEFGRGLMTSMGFAPTGERKTIIGIECEVFSAAGLGSNCISSNALTLEQDVLGNKMTAIEISHDGGNEEDYRLYEEVQIRRGPDLSNGLNIQDLVKQLQNK